MHHTSSTLRGAAHILGASAALYTLVAACTAGVGSGGSLDDFADAMTAPAGDANAGTVSSGSRLKATYIAGADGSKRVDPNVFWDSERNENCSFTTVSGGGVYCLPSYGSAELKSETRTYYSDSQCKQEIAGYMPQKACLGDAAPKYAGELVAATCTGVPTLARLRKMGTALNRVHEIDSSRPQSCYQSDSSSDPNAAGNRLFRVGEEIPFSAFVKGTAGHE